MKRPPSAPENMPSGLIVISTRLILRWKKYCIVCRLNSTDDRRFVIIGLVFRQEGRKILFERICIWAEGHERCPGCHYCIPISIDMYSRNQNKGRVKSLQVCGICIYSINNVFHINACSDSALLPEIGGYITLLFNMKKPIFHELIREILSRFSKIKLDFSPAGFRAQEKNI